MICRCTNLTGCIIRIEINAFNTVKKIVHLVDMPGDYSRRKRRLIILLRFNDLVDAFLGLSSPSDVGLVVGAAAMSLPCYALAIFEPLKNGLRRVVGGKPSNYFGLFVAAGRLELAEQRLERIHFALQLAVGLANALHPGLAKVRLVDALMPRGHTPATGRPLGIALMQRSASSNLRG